MHSLEHIQAEISAWSQGNFGDNISKDELSISYLHPLGSIPALLGMGEELGELYRITLRRHQGRGISDPDELKAAKEDALGDLLVFMCDYATREGINLWQILQTVWTKVQLRRQSTWETDKERAEQMEQMQKECSQHVIQDARPATEEEIRQYLSSDGIPIALPVGTTSKFRCPFCNGTGKMDYDTESGMGCVRCDETGWVSAGSDPMQDPSPSQLTEGAVIPDSSTENPLTNPLTDDVYNREGMNSTSELDSSEEDPPAPTCGCVHVWNLYGYQIRCARCGAVC